MKNFTCVQDIGNLKSALDEAFEIKKDRFIAGNVIEKAERIEAWMGDNPENERMPEVKHIMPVPVIPVSYWHPMEKALGMESGESSQFESFFNYYIIQRSNGTSKI